MKLLLPFFYLVTQNSFSYRNLSFIHLFCSPRSPKSLKLSVPVFCRLRRSLSWQKIRYRKKWPLPFFGKCYRDAKIINPWKGKSSSSIQKSILSFEWVIIYDSWIWHHNNESWALHFLGFLEIYNSRKFFGIYFHPDIFSISWKCPAHTSTVP